MPCNQEISSLSSLFASDLQHTGSFEKTGPSGTRLTVKELDFCRPGNQVRLEGIVEQVERATNAEEEPLEVAGHLEDGAALLFR